MTWPMAAPELTTSFAPLLRRPDARAWRRLFELRTQSIRERIFFAVAAGLAAAALTRDAWALIWIVASWAAVAGERYIWDLSAKRLDAGRSAPLRLACACVFVVAGVFGALSLLLWGKLGLHGPVIGALFLSAILLASIISLRTAPALVAVSILPSIGYLALAPFANGDVTSLTQAAAVVASVGFLAVFAWSTWVRMYKADEDERAAQEAARAAGLAAERAQAAKSAFLAGMSRDLRTPISMVLGAAAMLRRADLNAEHRTTVDAMLDAGDVLVTVLDDILAAASADPTDARISIAATSPAQIAQGVVRIWRPRAEDKWLELFLDIDPTADVVVETKQILFCLVSNAVRFTDAGGVRVRVSGTKQASGRMLLTFRVADTGPGFEPGKAEALLEGRTFGSGDNGGGSLTRCRALARALGGDVTVQTAPGEGATFTLTLDTVVSGADAQVDVGPAQAATRLRVLVVDDHPVSRRFAAEILSEMGALSTPANTGREALDLLESTPFDLVLLDINMPELSGYDVVRELRAGGHPATGVPVIALTAAAGAEDRSRCADAGMEGFVAKPITAAELFGEICRVLEAVDLRRAA
ncbi:MAG: response regulator [Alphaproteobacteria bacterium]|nr:response regulator [Alphaproteobacteria bacterium]